MWQRSSAASLLMNGGRHNVAVRIARDACDVLMREEHGEAGMALLLIAADEFRNDPHLTAHPFFEEGLRIVHAARFLPLPDKYIGLRDVLAHYESLRRTLEAGQLRDEIRKIEEQMTWEPGLAPTADVVEPALC